MRTVTCMVRAGTTINVPPHSCVTAPAPPQIGRLREGALHADLRAWFFQPGDQLEQPVDGFVIDLVRGELLVEFQTGGFSKLRRKLPVLLQRHAVRLVAPVAVARYILKVDDTGELLSQRRSPRRGRVEEIFAELASIPALLKHPLFTLEVVLVELDETRVHHPRRAFRRHGWVVCGRALRKVLGRVLITSAEQAAALLPHPLPDPFTTAEVASVGGLPLRLARQMAYCMLALGVIERIGKRGNAHCYRRVAGTLHCGRTSG